MVRRIQCAALATAVTFALVACTGRETVPIDLDGTIPLVETTVQSNEANAAAAAEGRRLAEQQCLDDPTLEEGLVQIAQPDTGVVVAEIVVPCDEVR